ncbi:class II poly(R)-hydroxyalkanoic acid synthase [Paramagnetospirillum kuznetsovii]|uniref:Class II poly(R)-hydroxyalkanoic acid synthase n=2 Tax=Paramagnetospirillum kuznetsovii TaxID=2053833 RepID=A0A364P085_9PROT|nr:class II poly(R)-hydroxyalkanoic acid synthase [Paramagnetospirillum kuznetsovii]
MKEQVGLAPGLAVEQAAELIRVLASPPIQEPGTPRTKAEEEKIKLGSPFIGSIGAGDIAATMAELYGRLGSRPQVVMEETGRYLAQWGRLLSGKSDLSPPKGDRRFDDPAWRENPIYRLSLQAYLAWSTAIDRLVDKAGADHRTTERMRYVASLFTEALAPNNALICNPSAMKRLLETGGGSLVEGMRNLIRDVATKNATPAQVDKSAFQVGETLAATPGAVVFRNEILELIQYAPTTAEVHAVPIMMVPPVVNKFYMMDMAPGRSLIEFMVGRGVQVYMISWRNPKPEHGHWDLDTYVAAMMEAVDAIRDIAASPEINTFTICTGAVPLVSLLGHLAAKRNPVVRSTTMVVSVVDSNEGRSLGLFATPATIRDAKRKSAESGVLSGEEMAKVFTWMRAKDLVWNYWVNNYLLGKQPPALDILYWNNDPIRLTAALHAQLLDIYSQDLLVKPGAMTILGTPIDLADIRHDTYVVGGITDHISVWKGVYNSARKFGGTMDFVLHSSGHVQSVINPPGTPKAKYWSNDHTPDSPEEWLASARINSDSWWRHWVEWLGRRSGERLPAPPMLGNDRYPAGAQAPGPYVREP